MPLLTTAEAFQVSDSFLHSLYGTDTFHRWTALKSEMNFITEKDYVNWLIDVAYSYKRDDCPGEQTNTEPEHVPANVAGSSSQCDNNIKAEAGDYDVGSYEDGNNYYKEQMEGVIALPDADSGTNADQVGDTVELSDNVSQRFIAAQTSASSSGSTPTTQQSLHAGGAGGGKRFECPHCSYRSKYKWDVMKHVRAIHERHKPHACPHCAHTTSRETLLRDHLVLKHGYRGKHTCGACGKRYAILSQLRKHGLACTGRTEPP